MSIATEKFELRRDRDDKPALVIRGEALIPEKPSGAVVICHGFKGFARFAFFPYVAKQLADAGLTAVTFDFSGSGVGEDRENFTNLEAFTHNTYLQELDDLEAVVSESRVNGWIDDGYGVFGHSRGGGIAILHTASDQKVKALVTWAAISSANRWPDHVVAEWRERGFIEVTNARTGQTARLSVELLNEVEELGETRLDIAAAAARVMAPWLILHGQSDETVEVAEAERLAALAAGPVTLKLVESGGHTFGGKHPLTEVVPMLERVTRETVSFFVRHLTSPGM